MKSSKYFILFLGLFISVNIIFLIVLRKYYAIFLHQTVVFCRETAGVLSFRLFNNGGVIIFILLLATILVAILRLLITVIKINKQKKDLLGKVVGSKSLIPLLMKHDLESQVLLINSPKPFAYCLGLRNPKIYISTKLIKILSRRELEVVLLHERYHLENQDTLILTLATIFKSLLPYFPILSDFINQYRVDRELAADRQACKVKRAEIYLSAALSKLLSFDVESSNIIGSAIADVDTLGPRINRLTNRTDNIRPISLKNIIASIVSVVMLSVLIVIPVHAIEIHSNGYDTMLVCASNQSCDRVCGESEMKLFQSQIK